MKLIIIAHGFNSMLSSAITSLLCILFYLLYYFVQKESCTCMDSKFSVIGSSVKLKQLPPESVEFSTTTDNIIKLAGNL